MECEANLQGRVISFNGEPNGTLLYDAGRSDALRPAVQRGSNKGFGDACRCAGIEGLYRKPFLCGEVGECLAGASCII